MSLEGPNPDNCLTVVVSVENGKHIFTPRLPQPKNLRWNANHRRVETLQHGRYFLTVVAQDALLASPAIVFKGAHKGISIYQEDSGESSSEATILISTDATEGERAEFWIVFQGGGTEDPTILVDPPHIGAEVKSHECESGTLLVRVRKEAGGYVYSELVSDSPNLTWNGGTTQATVHYYGTYFVVFGADFEFAKTAITFPQGQPSFVTLSETPHLGILRVEVEVGVAWPVTVQLQLNPKVPGKQGITEPTILVDPPHGSKDASQGEPARPASRARKSGRARSASNQGKSNHRGS